jgi:hypothetical protein
VARAFLAGFLTATAALATVTAAAQPNLAGPPPAPSLTGFSPVQGAQGTTVNITFNGNNFGAKGLGLQFSPATGITVQKLQAVSATQIAAQVQIGASAQLGPHAVILIVSDRSLQTPLSFTVTGAGCGLPGQPECPSHGPPPPALKGFSPLEATQGTRVTVVLTGSGFTSPAAVLFTPGVGISVQSTHVINANQVEAQLAIHESAPVGPRHVSLLTGKERLAARSTFTVAPIPMQILRVVPNEIPAGGENVELTLEGTSFVPGTMVSFTIGGDLPTDIFVVGAPRYVNNTEMHVIVNVLTTALPGGRDIHLQTPEQQDVMAKGILNVLAK